jgi:outer membrane protein assembly factor BamB
MKLPQWMSWSAGGFGVILLAVWAGAGLAGNLANAAQTDEPKSTDRWPMFGGSPDRNMVSPVKNVTIDFSLEGGDRLLWTAQLGSQTYGNPIVAGGKVFVATNNAAGYLEKYPGDQDKGVLACFDAETGEFLWQLTRDKLDTGGENDWPLQGICSSPIVEENRLWVVTNRCELLCLDVDGFRNGKNSGPFVDEVDQSERDADIIWKLDMIKELGVYPHHLATSSPVIHEDKVFLLTSNGANEAGTEVPAPQAPSFLAVDKNTGEVVWQHNQPGDKILDGQWSSPAVGIVKGKAQVYFPGGDGWLYAHDAESGEEIWRFDMNPKAAQWLGGGRGERNYMIATPVFYQNSVLLAAGQEPEHGDGVSFLYRIDATKTGDISAELGEWGQPGTPNPNSGVLWAYGGLGEDQEPAFRRSIATVAISEGMVFIPDFAGFVHCLDLETGQRHWEHDLMAHVWGAPVVVDGKVFVGNEDGNLVIFKATSEGAQILTEIPTVNFNSIYSSPTFVNERMYLTDRTRLYCIQVAN